MADQQDIIIKSEDAISFQTKLNNLSKTLEDYYQVLGQNLRAVNDKWRDQKFDEFDREFWASKEKIKSIAEDFRNFANGHLQQKIDEAKEYENS